jgi:DNA polymerase-3 subunit chi
MAEILFYHLERQPLERVLPQLLERSLSRGWRVVVEAASQERIAALDDHLWTYSEESFLPHLAGSEPGAETESLVLVATPENPNAAKVRFLIDGAALPSDPARYDRIVVMFDGQDDAAIAKARQDWKTAKAAGLDCTYWQETASGGWQKMA